jgi:WD40 repeat protein
MRFFKARVGRVIALGFNPGRSALTASVKGVGLYVWTFTDPQPAARALEPMVPFRYPDRLVFAQDGQSIFLNGATCRVAVSLTSGDSFDVYPSLQKNSPVADFCQSEDGRRVIFGLGGRWSHRNLVCFRQVDGGWAEEWSVELPESRFSAISLAPDGTCVGHFLLTSPVRGPRSYDVVIREGADGTVIGTGSYPYSFYTELQFRPDACQLVACHEATLLVWSIPELGTPLRIRNDNRRHFTAAVYHPSGRYLFTSSNDGTVVVWDTATWKRVTRFSWDIGRLQSLAISPDGTLAAAGSDRGKVVLWDVDL